MQGENRAGSWVGRIWTGPPTRERKGPNPKPEIRGPKEGRNPKSEWPEPGFGLRYSAFFRVSALGIRIWAAGDGWYYPVTPSGSQGCIKLPDRESSRSGRQRAWALDLLAPFCLRGRCEPGRLAVRELDADPARS